MEVYNLVEALMKDSIFVAGFCVIFSMMIFFSLAYTLSLKEIRTRFQESNNQDR